MVGKVFECGSHVVVDMILESAIRAEDRRAWFVLCCVVCCDKKEDGQERGKVYLEPHLLRYRDV